MDEASVRTERHVRTWMASGKDQEIYAIVSAISSGGTTLVDVVKSLGEYLTAEEDELRTKGVELLSAVLEKCPLDRLNRQSVRVLVSFYCGKLQDFETVVPAIEGLFTLSSSPNLTSTDSVEIVRTIFAQVDMKPLVQSQRFTVYSVLDALMAHHRDALKGLGKEFVSGYISLVDGEKDPRNLLLIFAIDRVILIEFDVSDFIEQFFNVTFCYFPITFRPPPDDPYGITSDDLKQALRSCLNATPEFGNLGIPLFLEKLMAGSPLTKRDTLRTLSACLPVYGAVTVKQFGKKLWNSLRLEIFQPTDPETEEEALKTFQALISTLYTARDVQEPDLASDICEECLKLIDEPEKSQAKPAAKTLGVFMSTTKPVFTYITSKAIPHLTELFYNPDELSSRPATLTLLTDIIVAARDATPKYEIDGDSDRPLVKHKDEVLGAFIVGLKSSSSCVPSLDGLKSLVAAEGLLTDEELGYVVHSVNEVLQSEWDNSDDVCDTALELLSLISSFSPKHVEQTTLPLLFAVLPDRAPPREADIERAKYMRTLSSLTRLCKQPTLFETLVIRLTTKVDLICEVSKSDEEVEANAAYAHAILVTLSNVLTAKIELGHPDIPKYVERLIAHLYSLFISDALQRSDIRTVATDTRLLKAAGQVITLVLRTAPVAKQESFTGALFEAYLKGEVTTLARGQQKITAEPHFHPFDASASSKQKNLVVLFSHSLIALQQQVSPPVPDLKVFLSTLLGWTIHHAETSIQREGIWHAVASIVNKHPDDIGSFLSDLVEHFWPSEIADRGVSPERRCHALGAWIWITKALLVRSHTSALDFIDRLFELFGDAGVGWDAARAIGQVASSDNILTKRNFATVKILFAQKLCNQLLPRLIEGTKTSDNQLQSAYLVALTSLVKALPKATYAPEMPTLVPLLLRSLELPDPEIRADVIDTLHAASEANLKESSLISEHASTLVLNMLRNSNIAHMPSARVRIAALRYLGMIPKIVRYDILHPQKATVIRELSKVLDDPKRAVRKEAVDARSNWFTYNG